MYTHTIQNRTPLAYVQFVQILVDTFVLVSPLALYADLGEYSVSAVGLVAFFYCGLNNLAKIFLDPLNNEDFCENSIYFDLAVIVSESDLSMACLTILFYGANYPTHHR